MTNIMTLNPMTAEELYSGMDLSAELILENFILFIASHFCVGTEMRLLDKKLESESWLAKASETAHLFLPSTCPLVAHLNSSFLKLFLNRKQKPKPVKLAKRVQINIPAKLAKSASSGLMKQVNLLKMY